MEIIIEPKTKLWNFGWKELWQFKDLFYFLTWRDIKVRYKQTFIGASWAIFQPLVTMIIFSIFFGKFAKIPSDNIPYPIFFYSGLIFWTLFSSGLSHASNSFIENEKIVTKIFFPRIILPVSSLITNVIDFVISLGVLVVLMFVYGYYPSIFTILAIPVLAALSVLAALGIGLLFSSLNVKYRDVRFVLPFFIQLLIFLTPVIYPTSIISQEYRWILGLNPMSGIVDTARSVILQSSQVDWLLLGVSLLSMLVYILLGFFYFKHMERYFADII